ncbi:MAG: hypothetical protein ABIF40_02060 [archaeon]
MKLKVGLMSRDTGDLGSYTPSKDGVYGSALDDILCLVEECDVVAGPEWLFLPRDRLHDTYEKDNLISKLCDATKGQTKLVLPGTIFWHDGDYAYNTCPIVANGELVGEYHKYYSGGDEQIVFDENTRRGEIKEKKFHQLRNYLQLTGRSLDDIFPELKKLKWKAGNEKAYNFTWEGLNVGAAICADASGLHHRLHSEDPEEKIDRLDLHFLVSCGNTLANHSLALKHNGYALCSNGVSNPGLRVEVLKYEFDPSIHRFPSTGTVPEIKEIEEHAEGLIYEIEVEE